MTDINFSTHAAHPYPHCKRLGRQQAFDRRLVAIHEAGHLIIANHLGYPGRARIWPTHTINPASEKTWLGQMGLWLQPSSSDHARMIGVAGMVGETLWRNEYRDEYDDEWLWDQLLCDQAAMSPTDWQLTGCEPGDPSYELIEAAVKVAELLMGELWDALVNEARLMISAYYPDDLEDAA